MLFMFHCDDLRAALCVVVFAVMNSRDSLNNHDNFVILLNCVFELKGFCYQAWLMYQRVIWISEWNSVVTLPAQFLSILSIVCWTLGASVSFFCEIYLCFPKCLLWKGVGRNHTVLIVLVVYCRTGMVAFSQASPDLQRVEGDSVSRSWVSSDLQC